MLHSIGPWPGTKAKRVLVAEWVFGRFAQAQGLAFVVMTIQSLTASATPTEALDLSVPKGTPSQAEAPSRPTEKTDQQQYDGRESRLAGAVTSVVNWGPQYMGSKNYAWSLKPGLLLRYRSWSISSNGNFAARTDEDPNDLPRGLGLNLLGNQHDWVKLSLRVDSGRKSKGVDGLQGVDDVPRTLRLRFSARKEWGDGWVITPGVNVDLLKKGVGHTADLSVGKDWQLSPKVKWSVSTGVTWASAGYMRSYFGISPSESIASGYSVYEPGSGFRDVRMGAGLRYELNRRWVFVSHASMQRLVGQAASSPTTQAATQWGVGGGLGWRF
jgi:outer membrane protein